jgi:hypothetical protein
MSGTTVHARVLHPWEAQDASQLSVAVDDDVLVDSAVDTSSGWMFCKLTSTGTEGTFFLPFFFSVVTCNFIDIHSVFQATFLLLMPK